VAISDPTGSLARPVEIYHRMGDGQKTTDLQADVQHVLDLAAELSASSAVVGLPKNMNGTEGPQAHKTREFAAALEEKGCTVVLWDERLSTIEATRRMSGQRHRTNHLGVRARGSKRRGPAVMRVDSEAAAIILQNYLDYLRFRSAAPSAGSTRMDVEI
jgi:putative Holliday junction resolvase